MRAGKVGHFIRRLLEPYINRGIYMHLSRRIYRPITEGYYIPAKLFIAKVIAAHIEIFILASDIDYWN